MYLSSFCSVSTAKRNYKFFCPTAMLLGVCITRGTRFMLKDVSALSFTRLVLSQLESRECAVRPVDA